MVKIILRINLNDFLHKPYEETVIKKLEEIHRDSIKYYLSLWYEDGTVLTKDLKKFLLNYESRLNFKTTIKVGNKLKINDFIWFDIINKKYKNDSNRTRFQYAYNREEEVLNGLNEFYKCAKFCTSDKPPKRQKRNDYESSNSR